MLCCDFDNEALETAFNALLDTLRPLLGSAAQPHCMQGKATFAVDSPSFKPSVDCRYTSSLWLDQFRP